MDSGFFADPDPDFKIQELTKKDSVESAKYEIHFFLLVLTVLGRFLWVRIRIFPDFRPIRSQKKKLDPDPEKNPDPKHCGIPNKSRILLSL